MGISFLILSLNLTCRMTTLVECWNKLDGNVGELSSWVTTKVFHPTTLELTIFIFFEVESAYFLVTIST